MPGKKPGNPLDDQQHPVSVTGGLTWDLRCSLLKPIHCTESHRERLRSGALRAISDQGNTSTTASREETPFGPTYTRSVCGGGGGGWGSEGVRCFDIYSWIEISHLRTGAEVQLSFLSPETRQTGPQGTSPQRTDNGCRDGGWEGADL